MKPNDKPKQTTENYEDPLLFVVIGDEVFPRTGLETAFVDYTADIDMPENESTDSNKKKTTIVGGEVCTCNKVRIVSCNCVGYRPKSTRSSRPKSTPSSRPSRSSGGRSGSGSRSGCRCAPVH